MSDVEANDAERFPVEIAAALDALGDRECRQMLARIVDAEQVETDVGPEERAAAETLVNAGLVTKQVHHEDEGEIVGVYRISEYGRRFVESVFSTFGDIELADSPTEDDASDAAEPTVYVHEFQVTRHKLTESEETAQKWGRLGNKVWEVDLN